MGKVGRLNWTRSQAPSVLFQKTHTCWAFLWPDPEFGAKDVTVHMGWVKGKALGPDCLDFHPNSVPEQLGKHEEVTSCF